MFRIYKRKSYNVVLRCMQMLSEAATVVILELKNILASVYKHSPNSTRTKKKLYISPKIWCLTLNRSSQPPKAKGTESLYVIITIYYFLKMHCVERSSGNKSLKCRELTAIISTILHTLSY